MISSLPAVLMDAYFFVTAVCVIENFVSSFTIFFGEKRRKIRLSPTKSVEFANNNWNLNAFSVDLISVGTATKARVNVACVRVGCVSLQ